MEIRIAYRSYLIGWILALAAFSYMKIVSQHATPAQCCYQFIATELKLISVPAHAMAPNVSKKQKASRKNYVTYAFLQIWYVNCE